MRNLVTSIKRRLVLSRRRDEYAISGSSFGDMSEEEVSMLHRNMARTRCYSSRGYQHPRICLSVVVLATIICAVLFAYTAFSLSTEDDSVKQVAFVFRHGDRTPTETYVNDPYANYTWPGGWGALTTKGMRQLYNVGRWIRVNYGSIVGYKYESKNTSVRSSYADRCIMSAQSLLAGLYPPTPEEIFVPDLPWRPIPVHYTPREMDKVIVVKAPCPRLEEALKEAYQNESAKSDAEMFTYYEELTKYTGQPVKTITDVEFLYNTLEIEEQNGLQLPEWTKKFYNEDMRKIAARSLSIFTSNTLQQRLRGGPILKEILQEMENEKKKNRKKAYLYSTHDVNLVNMLRTMGFTNELFKPDYGAMLIFELHSIKGSEDRKVKIAYLNSSESNEAHRMTIPNCSEPCLLTNLINLWSNVIPTNWDEECRVKL